MKPGPLDRPPVALAASLGLLALGVRLLAGRGDLWLDEIWSLDGVRPLHSVLDVFTAIHSDNNHYLTSIYLKLVGDGAPYVVYRLPSALAGALTTVLGALPPISRRPREALFTGLLLATSPLLVQYDSEARGYAIAALCAVACYGCFDRFQASHAWTPALVFALLASVGCLGQLTFVYALLGFAAWGGRDAYRRWKLDPRFLVAVGVPFAVFVWLWWVDLRLVLVSGGKVQPLAQVLSDWVTALVGLPRPFGMVALALGAAALGVEGEPSEGKPVPWTFFLATILGAPLLFLLWLRPEYVAPRYFLMSAPFVLLLLAKALVRLGDMGRAGLKLAAAALAVVVIASVWRDAELIHLGRGSFAEAVSYLSEHTGGPVVTVGGDHDLRNGKVVTWYARRLAGPKPIQYRSAADWPEHPPEWYLVHDPGAGPAAAELTAPKGGHYVLAEHYPHAGLSGWDWYVYHRDRP